MAFLQDTQVSSLYVTGSITASLGITGSLTGTASYANVAGSVVGGIATATFATLAGTATASLWATSSLVATSSRYSVQATNATSSISATFAGLAGRATASLWATSSLVATSSRYSVQATNATSSISATFAGLAGRATASLWATSSLVSTSSFSASNATNALIATYVGVTTSNPNSNYAVPYVSASTGKHALLIDPDASLRYNPSENTLLVLQVSASGVTGSLLGTASLATTSSYAGTASVLVSPTIPISIKAAGTSDFITFWDTSLGSAVSGINAGSQFPYLLLSDASGPDTNRAALYTQLTAAEGAVLHLKDLDGNTYIRSRTSSSFKNPIIAPSFTGSLQGTASYAGTASFAATTIKVFQLTDAATIVTDLASGSHFRVGLSGSRTLGNPSGMSDGDRAVWEFIQDGTGNRVLTLGTAFRLSKDIQTLTLSTESYARDYMSAIYNTGRSEWDVVSFIRGFNASGSGAPLVISASHALVADSVNGTVTTSETASYLSDPTTAAGLLDVKGQLYVTGSTTHAANIGIATVPQVKLHISGSGENIALQAGGPTWLSYYTQGPYGAANRSGWFGFGSSVNPYYLTIGMDIPSGSIAFYQNSQYGLVFTGSRLGIGTTQPQGTFHSYTSTNYFNFNGNLINWYSASNGGLLVHRNVAANGNVYIQAASASLTGAGANILFTAMNANPEWMRITDTGYVGIGTAAVTYGKLCLMQSADGAAEGFGIFGTSKTTARMYLESDNTFRINRSTYSPAAIVINATDPPSIGIGTETLQSGAKITIGGLLYGDGTTGRVGMGTTTNYGPISFWKDQTTVNSDQRGMWGLLRRQPSTENSGGATIAHDLWSVLSPQAANAGSTYGSWLDTNVIRATSYMSSSFAATASQVSVIEARGYAQGTSYISELAGLRSSLYCYAGSVINTSYLLYLETSLWGAGGSPGTINNKFGVYQAGSADVNYFNASVGLGTTTPTHRLTVGSTTAGVTNVIRVNSYSGSAGLELTADWRNLEEYWGNAAYVYLSQDSTATPRAVDAIFSGCQVAGVLPNGDLYNGVPANGYVLGTLFNAGLYFGTGQTASVYISSTNHLYTLPSSSIGIGTATIDGTIQPSLHIYDTGDAGTTTPSIYFDASERGTSQWVNYAATTAWAFNSSRGRAIQWGWTSTASGNVRMALSGSGELMVVGGAGTANPIRIGGVTGFAGYNQIYLNGSTTGNDYNFLTLPATPHLLINRPTGNYIHFRENNSTQMAIETGGNVGIGTTVISSTKFYTYHSDSNASGLVRGGRIYLATTANGSQTVVGQEVQAVGAGSVSSLTGRIIGCVISGSSTISTATASVVVGAEIGANVVGNVTTILKTLDLKNNLIGTASGAYVANSTLLYLNTIGGTPIGTKYAIFQEGANDKNYFAGFVGVGTSTPANGSLVNLYHGTQPLMYLDTAAGNNYVYLGLTEILNYGMVLRYGGAENEGVLGMVENTVITSSAMVKRLVMDRSTPNIYVPSGSTFGVGMSTPDQTVNMHVSGSMRVQVQNEVSAALSPVLDHFMRVYVSGSTYSYWVPVYRSTFGV